MVNLWVFAQKDTIIAAPEQILMIPFSTKISDFFHVVTCLTVGNICTEVPVPRERKGAASVLVYLYMLEEGPQAQKKLQMEDGDKCQNICLSSHS